MKKILFVLVIIAFGAFMPNTAQACQKCLHSKHHKAHSCCSAQHEAAMPNMTKTAKTKADHALKKVSLNMHHAMDVALVGTPDVDFLHAMIPHHQGAIDMAEVVLKYGKDPDIAWLARNIIKAQRGEIYWMSRLLDRANVARNVSTGGGAMDRTATTPVKKAFAHIHHAMHEGMDIKFVGDPDVDFVRGMIPHHQGAIDMAVWVRAHGSNTDVRELTDEIIRAQRAEIAWMKAWLERRNAK